MLGAFAGIADDNHAHSEQVIGLGEELPVISLVAIFTRGGDGPAPRPGIRC